MSQLSLFNATRSVRQGLIHHISQVCGNAKRTTPETNPFNRYFTIHSLSPLQAYSQSSFVVSKDAFVSGLTIFLPSSDHIQYPPGPRAPLQSRKAQYYLMKYLLGSMKGKKGDTKAELQNHQNWNRCLLLYPAFKSFFGLVRDCVRMKKSEVRQEYIMQTAKTDQ